MSEIAIDAVTQGELRNLAAVMNDAQTKMQMICNVYVRSQGSEGQYDLSADLTKLILREEDADG